MWAVVADEVGLDAPSLKPENNAVRELLFLGQCYRAGKSCTKITGWQEQANLLTPHTSVTTHLHSRPWGPARGNQDRSPGPRGGVSVYQGRAFLQVPAFFSVPADLG